jgi:hypothetical protein
MNKFIVALILLIPLLSACQDDPDKPEDLIRESDYIDLLTEVFLVQSIAELRGIEEKKDSLYTIVFDHYQVTRDQFDRSHTFYQRQGEPQVVRTDSVREILRREREALMRARFQSDEAETQNEPEVEYDSDDESGDAPDE